MVLACGTNVADEWLCTSENSSFWATRAIGRPFVAVDLSHLADGLSREGGEGGEREKRVSSGLLHPDKVKQGSPTNTMEHHEKKNQLTHSSFDRRPTVLPYLPTVQRPVHSSGFVMRSLLYQVPIGFSNKHTTLAGRDDMCLATCEPQARGW